MAVIEITSENFEEKVLNSPTTVLLDFWASWCMPCRMLSPIIDEVAEEKPELTVGKINVDDEPELADRYGIMSIPTLIVIENGEVKTKAVGGRIRKISLKCLNDWKRPARKAFRAGLFLSDKRLQSIVRPAGEITKDIQCVFCIDISVAVYICGVKVYGKRIHSVVPSRHIPDKSHGILHVDGTVIIHIAGDGVTVNIVESFHCIGIVILVAVQVHVEITVFV